MSREPSDPKRATRPKRTSRTIRTSTPTGHVQKHRSRLLQSTAIVLSSLTITVLIILIVRDSQNRNLINSIINRHVLFKRFNNHLTTTATTTTSTPNQELDDDPDEQPSRIDYIRIFNSTPPNLRPVLIIIMTLWLMFLFSFVGIVASDFFCPNLSTLSNRLGLNESLAGVTFLGFGNGAPDVFSTFAAMKSGTGSLAIGELIGAASFIVSVVLGSMCLVRPFRVERQSFLRDLGFFTLAIALILIIIMDGRIRRWEANMLMILYVIYVITVGFGTWYSHHRRSRIELIQRVRSEFAESDSPLIRTNYLDDDDTGHDHEHESLLKNGGGSSNSNQTVRSPEAIEEDHQRPFPLVHHSSSRSNVSSFQTLLESNEYHHPINVAFPIRNRRMRAPSLSYCTQPLTSPPAPPPALSSASSSSQLSFRPLPRSTNQSRSPSFVSSHADEESNYLPRRRPRQARNSIRPGLLGAIEFRDVVNSLARESRQSIWSSPPPAGAHRSAPGSRKRSDSYNVLVRGSNNSARTSPSHSHHNSESSNLRLNLGSPSIKLSIDSQNFRSDNSRVQSQSAIVPPSPPPWELDGFKVQRDNSILSPLRGEGRVMGIGLSEENREECFPMSRKRSDSSRGSPNLPPVDENGLEEAPRSPTDDRLSPKASRKKKKSSMTPEIPSIMITAETGDAYSLPQSGTEWNNINKAPRPDDGEAQSALRGRRYPRWRKLLKVFFRVLLPTLKGWKEKSYLGKFVALMSSPAIFVLSLTLPVVDDDSTEIVEAVEIPNESNLIEFEEEEEEEEDRGGPELVLIGERDVDGSSGKTVDGAVEGELNVGSLRGYQEEDRGGADECTFKQPSSSRSTTLQADCHIEGVELAGTEDMKVTEGGVEEEYPDSLTAHWLAVVQCVLAPPFCVISLSDYDNLEEVRLMSRIETSRFSLYLIGSIIFGISLGFIASRGLKKSNSPLKIGLCLIGFVVSMVWILSIVNEVVGVIKCIGEVFGVSDAILGLTVFGIGNSLGDFVANVTIAKMGYPLMAVSACFGGPMLNILMGIGFSSSYLLGKTNQSEEQSLKQLNDNHDGKIFRKINDSTGGGGGGGGSVVKIESSRSLIISSIGLLLVLGSMMVIVPMRKFKFDRVLGIVLLFEYLVIFCGNLVVEIYF